MVAPLIPQPQVFISGAHAIRITEIVVNGWPEGFTWSVTDRDGLVEFASGDVDYPGEHGFKTAMKTAHAVLRDVAAADALEGN